MLRKLLRVLGIVLAAAIVIGAALLLYLEPYVTYDRDGAHLSLKKNAQDPDGTGATAALPEVSDAQIVYDEAQPGSDRIADLGGVYVTTQMLRDPEALRAALEQQGACAVLLQLKSTFGNFYYSSSIDGAELADVQFGDTVLVVGIGPVGLMSVAGAALRGAARILAVGTRPVCVEAARQYGASDFISYKDGPIDEQVLELTGGKGVDCAIIAGGDADTFIPVIKALKPGGNIGNVNYLGSGEYVRLPRAEWGVGMGHKQINGGLMPGGRLRMEKLAALMTNGRLDVKPLITHVYDGWDALPQALRLMKDKPRDLIKPVVRL